MSNAIKSSASKPPRSGYGKRAVGGSVQRMRTVSKSRAAATKSCRQQKGTPRFRPRARISRRIVFSTGILRRNPCTAFALVDLANLGATVARRMTVQVFDWSRGLPVALKLLPCNSTRCFVSLAPGTADFVYADVTGVEFKYEVRISKASVNRNVILNVSGLSAEPMTPQTGDNVLHHQLFRITGRIGSIESGCGCRS
ncbi:hypothetical protein [Paenibacillus glycinis]|uniref:hypothetical protein n=1 Tax=Paenibacillus glycinis TaxID=2697035 RepID=UPI00191C2EB9|nr:hypothetical protein [Paenibacillus glycinis]